MVGLTMVLAIAICIFGAAGLFAWLSGPFSDLVPMIAPAAERPVETESEAPAEDPVVPEQTAAEPEVPEVAQQEPTIAASEDDFEPTHQIAPGDTINFRAGPSTADPIIIALSPATPLQYLDEDQPTVNPGDGSRWMKFRNENGDEGWVREIDTEPYVP
jgi:hypothetical protein